MLDIRVTQIWIPWPPCKTSQWLLIMAEMDVYNYEICADIALVSCIQTMRHAKIGEFSCLSDTGDLRSVSCQLDLCKVRNRNQFRINSVKRAVKHPGPGLSGNYLFKIGYCTQDERPCTAIYITQLTMLLSSSKAFKRRECLVFCDQIGTFVGTASWPQLWRLPRLWTSSWTTMCRQNQMMETQWLMWPSSSLWGYLFCFPHYSILICLAKRLEGDDSFWWSILLILPF